MLVGPRVRKKTVTEQMKVKCEQAKKARIRNFLCTPELSPFSALLESNRRKQQEPQITPLKSHSYVTAAQTAAPNSQFPCKETTPPPQTTTADVKVALDSPEVLKSFHDMVLTPLRTPELPIVQGCPEVPSSLLKYISPVHSVPLSERDKVLALCEQTEPIPFDHFFSLRMIKSVEKVGEGAFSDVFSCLSEQDTKLAIKLVPIEGDIKYNGDPQSRYEDVLPEMVISRELSALGDNSRDHKNPNSSPGFVSIYRMAVCKGPYPEYLLDAWDTFDFSHDSDNDRPDVFKDDQLYLLFAAENAGVPISDYVYHSYEEFHSIIAQVAGTLAVGELALNFEHRDLHRGNVLVKKTKQSTFTITLEGKDYIIDTFGVKATIIDYTLSRLSQGSCVSYNDLNRLPWLMQGKDDIQFDVYRDMWNVTLGHWDLYAPYTNVLWINYLIRKIQTKGRLRRISSKKFTEKIENYANNTLRFKSAQETFKYLYDNSKLFMAAKKPQRAKR